MTIRAYTFELLENFTSIPFLSAKGVLFNIWYIILHKVHLPHKSGLMYLMSNGKQKRENMEYCRAKLNLEFYQFGFKDL